MTCSFRTRIGVGISVLACVAGLAACGGSSPTKSTATTSPPPGSGDAAICQLVAKATTAYAAKDYSMWRSYMTQIAEAAGSARYLPLKRYAEQIKEANRSAATTTTKPKAKSKNGSAVQLGGSFAALGGYVGLKHVCAKPPLAPGSLSQTTTQQSSTGNTPGGPTTKGSTSGGGAGAGGNGNGKVVVGF